MDFNKFPTICKELVAEHFNDNMDKSQKTPITADDVYVVWYCKTLQNAKALLSTNVPDGMYYELTYNGNADEIYFDAYKKFQNKVVNMEG